MSCVAVVSCAYGEQEIRGNIAISHSKDLEVLHLCADCSEAFCPIQQWPERPIPRCLEEEGW